MEEKGERQGKNDMRNVRKGSTMDTTGRNKKNKKIEKAARHREIIYSIIFGAMAALVGKMATNQAKITTNNKIVVAFFYTWLYCYTPKRRTSGKLHAQPNVICIQYLCLCNNTAVFVCMRNGE